MIEERHIFINTCSNKQSVMSYYMDLMEESNCIFDMKSNKRILYTFDDDIFRFLSTVKDVEENFYDDIPSFSSKTIKEKLGLECFNFLYWDFKK